jgi:long-chain acyl-CoA synthetase
MPIDLTEEVYRKAMLPNPSVGVALPDVEIKIGDEDKEGLIGELQVKSLSNCLGYWGETVLPDEWLRTGDLGYFKVIEGKRFYYLTGRIKEQINRGGETISPVFVEEELRGLGLNGDFVVIPIPDAVLGEEVGLACVGGVERQLLDAIPWHRRPKRIFVIDKIPLTAAGKVQRRKMSEIIQRDFL